MSAGLQVESLGFNLGKVEQGRLASTFSRAKISLCKIDRNHVSSLQIVPSMPSDVCNYPRVLRSYYMS